MIKNSWKEKIGDILYQNFLKNLIVQIKKIQVHLLREKQIGKAILKVIMKYSLCGLFLQLFLLLRYCLQFFQKYCLKNQILSPKKNNFKNEKFDFYIKIASICVISIN